MLSNDMEELRIRRANKAILYTFFGQRENFEEDKEKRHLTELTTL